MLYRSVRNRYSGTEIFIKNLSCPYVLKIRKSMKERKGRKQIFPWFVWFFFQVICSPRQTSWQWLSSGDTVCQHRGGHHLQPNYTHRDDTTLTLSDISADRALHNLLEKPYVIFWKAIIFKILFVWKQELKMGFSKHILLLQQHQFKSNNSGTYSFSHLSLLSNTPSSKVPPRSISL